MWRGRWVLAGFFVVVLAFSAVVPAYAANGDWVTYQATTGRSGFNANETAITPTTASKLHLAWTATAQASYPNLIYSQPVVANGMVYWASFDGYERATNTSGGLVWQTYIGRTAACFFTNGPASTAAVVNSVIYVGGGDAQLYALNAANGSILWHTRMGPSPSTFVWSSPAVYGGSVYIGVASYADCPLVQGQLVKLDGTTGAVQNVMTVVPNGCTGGSIWSSPAVDEAVGTVYFATGNPGKCSKAEPYAEAVVEVRASDLSVVSKWQIPGSESTADGDFGSTPTLFARTTRTGTQAMVAIGNKNGIYYAFQRDHLGGGPRWKIQLAIAGDNPEQGQGTIAPSSWDGHTIYAAGGQTTVNGVSCAGSVVALNPANGGIAWWDCLPDGPVLGAVAEVPGVVVVGEGNQIRALSATSGQTLFTYTTQTPIFGAPSISNGILYQGDNGGTLYALSVTGPVTKVLIPSDGASLSGNQLLDASASDGVNVTRVEFRLSGGTRNDVVVATASPTYYGWMGSWDTTGVPNGTYALQSVAYDAAGHVGRSPATTVTVSN